MKVLFAVLATAVAGVWSALGADLYYGNWRYELRTGEGGRTYAELVGYSSPGHQEEVTTPTSVYHSADGTTYPVGTYPVGRIGSIGSSVDCDTLKVDGNSGSVAVSPSAFKGCTMRKLVLTGVSAVEGPVASHYGDGAFRGCPNLEEVETDGCLKDIGINAFRGCPKLVSFTGATAVTNIRNAVFQDCSALAAAVLPATLQTIGGDAFYGCAAIRSVEIPDATTAIGSYAFDGCTSLTNLSLGSGWRPVVADRFPRDAEGLDTLTVRGTGDVVVADNAFQGFKMRHVQLEGVSAIEGPVASHYGVGAFRNCPNLEEVETDGRLKDIGINAFRSCTNLVSFTGVAVTNVRDSAFRDCSALAEAVLPATLKTIGEDAFRNCPSIRSVEIPDATTAIGSYAFDGCTSLTNLSLGSGWQRIVADRRFPSNAEDLDTLTVRGTGDVVVANYAFQGFKMRHVKLEGVSAIEGPVASHYGEGAFRDCPNLVTVECDGSLASLGINAFRDCVSLTTFAGATGLKSIGDMAFAGCTALTAFDIPGQVETVGAWAFYDCTKLARVTVPDSVTSLGSGVFAGCSSLADISLGSGLARIENDRFPATIAPNATLKIAGSGTTVISPSAFKGCTMRKLVLKGVSAIEGPVASHYGDGAFRGCPNLEEVETDGCLKDIGINAFRGCPKLVSFTGATAVTNIRNAVFQDCSALAAAVLPATLQTIGGDAFYGCTAIRSVEIPDATTAIGSYAFYGCTSLTNLSLGSGWRPIVADRFPSDAEGLDTLTVRGTGDVVIASNAFQGFKMRHVKLSGVSKIEGSSYSYQDTGAFRNCPNLVTVKCDDSLASIGINVFRDTPLRGVRFAGLPPEGVDMDYNIGYFEGSETTIVLYRHAYADAWKDIKLPHARLVEEPEKGVNWTPDTTRDWPSVEGVIAHCGTLTSNEVWTAGCVHVVNGWVTVPDGVTLTIEPGAIVKFCKGMGIYVLEVGACRMPGVTLTHIADDEVGGDTNGDGGASKPKVGEYMVLPFGRVETDGHTTDRYRTPVVRVVSATGWQRFPWNGKVDVDVELWCNEATEKISFAWISPDGAETNAARIARVDDMSVVQDAWEVGTVGTIRTNFVWDADADLPNRTGTFGLRVTGENAETASVELNTMSNLFVCGAVDLAFSTKWSGAANVTVWAGEDVLTNATGPAEGYVTWTPPTGARGEFELVHLAGGETQTVAAVVLDESAVLHAETVAGDETWSADVVHVVNGRVDVVNGATLTIEPGAVVKFADGSALAVDGASTCVAGGVVFTHLDDDTVGGDIRGDGDEHQPRDGAYQVYGNVLDDRETDYRYMAPLELKGTIEGHQVLRGGSTSVVRSNVTVAKDATLEIRPGAVVKFASRCSLTVNGTLEAEGLKSRPIVFTSIKDDDRGGDTNGDADATYAQPGDWYQIKVTGVADFSYCQVLYGASTENYGAVEAYGGTVNFDNSVIAHTKYECVNAHSSGTLTARNSAFWDSSLGFGYYGSGRVKAYNCVFADLTVGIRQSGKTLTNCAFYRCLAFTDQSGDGSTFKNCVFYNPQDFGAQSYAKVGKDGNVWADPKFVDPANGDFRVADDSPCVDAADGTVAPALDFYGQPRMDARGRDATGVKNADGVCPDIGIYEVFGKAAVPVPDLEVVSVTPPETAIPGEEITFTYVITNCGGTNAVGLVRDRILMKGADAALGGQEIAAGEVQQTYSLAAGASATLTAWVTCPAVRGGNWTVGVTVNAERDVFEQSYARNTGWAEATTAVAMDELPAGESPMTIAAGAAKGFVLGAGVKTVRVTGGAGLDKVAVSGANGAVPATAADGVAAVRLDDGSWLLVLPQAKADEKSYVVIENGGDAPVDVTATAEAEKLAVLGIAPNRVAAADGVSVTITGTGLAEGLAVTLGGRSATRVSKVNEAQLAATFDLKGMAAGAAEVAVSGGAGRAALPVEVYKTTQGPKLEASLELPSSVRDGRVFTAYVVYANVGDEPMTMPVFKVERVDSSTKLGLSMTEALSETKVFVCGISPNAPAGVLQPGDAGRIPVYFQPFGRYRLKLTHTKETDNTEQFAAFGGVKAYLAAMSAAATRLNLRGRTEYNAHEFVEQSLGEKSGAAWAAVSGTLRDELTREPIANAEISLVPTNAAGVSVCATTDATGYFQIRNVADGDYLWVLNAGATPVSSNIVTVAGQTDLNGVEVLALAGGRISGHVYRDNGQPLGGCGLVVYDGGRMPICCTNADNSGAFEFAGLADGVYAVRAKACDGYLTKVMTNIAISAAARTARVEFELVRGGIVCGTVTSAETGTSVTNGAVQAITPGGVSYEVTCDEEGSYRFEGLPAGEYAVRYYTADELSDDTDVTIAVGDTVVCDLTAKLRPVFYATRTIGFGTLTTQFLLNQPSLTNRISNLKWDFDSDGTVDSTGPNPTWTYSGLSTNTVTLTFVEDGVTKICVYEDCTRVEEKLETILKDNAIIFFGEKKNSGELAVVSKTEGKMTLSGTPGTVPVAEGVVLYGQFGDEWFCRKVTSCVATSSGWNLTTQPAELVDVYEQYTEAFYSAEAPAEPKRVKKLLRAANATKAFFEGGMSITPSITPDFRLEFVHGIVKGKERLKRVCVMGSLELGLSGNFNGSLGVKRKWPLNLPALIIPAPAGVTVHADQEVAVEVSAQGTAESGSLGGHLSAALQMGVEMQANGKPKWLPPFAFDAGLDGMKGGLGGSVSAKFSSQTMIKVKFLETMSAGWAPEAYVKFEASAGTSKPPSASLTAGLDVIGEANLVDWEAGWVEVKIGISGRIEGPKAQLFSWTGPTPQFNYTPPSPQSAPATFDFENKSKDEELRIGFNVTTFEPQGYQWDFGNGNTSTKADPSATYNKEGTYIVALKAMGKYLNALNYWAKKKVIVGDKEDPEDDGDDEEDDEGDGESAKSWDPNEMDGPLGAGDPETQRFVKPGDWMTYTVYFENKADADADAQEVWVTNPLSEYLDWSTFEMGEVAVNNTIDLGLVGLQNGTSEMKLNGSVLKARTEVSLDTKKGEVSWYLRVVDPTTVTSWPDDVYVGILPPNDETHRGEAHLTYRVKVREDAPRGVRIDNSATIVFDYNPPIETDPAWWNTVTLPQGVTVTVDGKTMTLELVVGLPYGELPDPGTPPEGHSFGGWFTQPNGKGRQITEGSLVEAGDTGLYQLWAVNAYAVRFVPNGADGGEMPDQTFVYGEEQALASNRFIRTDYAFAGWATSEGGAVVYADGETVKNLTAIADDVVTLYAVWAEIPVPTLYDDAAKFIDVEGGEVAPYEKAATVYDGYLADADGVVKGTIQVKVAKGKTDKKSGAFSAKVTATVQLADGSKKISFKNGIADEYGNVTGLIAKGYELGVSLGVNGMGGSFRREADVVSCLIDGARNIFSAKDAESKAAAKAIESMWVGAVNVVGDNVALAVSIAKKGKVKVSGTVNGAKVSATSQLLVGEEACCVPVVITKKANLAFNLWLLADGSIEIAGLEGVVAGKAGALKSGASFRMDGAALAAALTGLYGDYLPDGLSVMQSKTKWIVAPDEKGKAAKAGKLVLDKKTGEIDSAKSKIDGFNVSGLKLTYKSKDGSFKGSFKVYNLEKGKIKAYTVNVTGVMVGDKGYGTATLKKPAVSIPIAIE